MHDPLVEHAEWLAAYDTYDPGKDVWPRPKVEEAYLRVEARGFRPVTVERCAQCKQLSRVGGPGGVYPYYVQPAGEGKPGHRAVVIRWLHQGECAEAWYERYRQWKKQREHRDDGAGGASGAHGTSGVAS